MAPEQDEGQTTEASDVYALGAVLFEAWTGTRAPSLARKPPTWPPTTSAEHGLRNLIAAMLDEDATERPTAVAARDALANADAVSGATQVVLPVADGPSGRSRRPRFAIFGVGIVAVLLVGAAIGSSMLTGSEDPSDGGDVVAADASTVEPTAEPSAVAVSGTRWLVQGYQSGTSARRDCDTFAATDGPSVPDKTEVTLQLEGVVRCAGWYQVLAVNREFWVLSTHLSSTSPVAATAVPTAVPATGRRWIAKTGGVGVRSRQSCSENAITSGASLPERAQVSLVLRGTERCAGWYRVSYAGQRVWVQQKFLSTVEPTAVPTATPTPTLAPTPSPTPSPAAGSTRPEIVAICNEAVTEDVTYEVCTARFAAGVRWDETFTWFGRTDWEETLSYAIDSEIVDWSALPWLTPGEHTIQVYSPPGGDYEGWSAPLSFMVIE